MTDHDYELAEKWVAHQLTEEEHHALLNRMEEDAQFKKDFEQTIQLIEDLHLLQHSHLPDGYQNALHQLESQLATEDTVKPITPSTFKKWIPWVGVAAAIVIAVVFLLPENPDNPPPVIVGPTINTNYIILDTAIFKNPEIITHPKTHLSLNDYREIQKGILAYNHKDTALAKRLLSPYAAALPNDTTFQSLLTFLEITN